MPNLIIDQDIQLDPFPAPSVGSSIGGCAPAMYQVIQGDPDDEGGVLLTATGSSLAGPPGNFPTVCFSPSRFWPLRKQNVLMDLWIEPDQAATLFLNSLETDLMCAGPDGELYDMSMDLKYPEGIIRISQGAQTHWMETVGPLTPDVLHHYQVSYQVNLAAKTCSILSVQIDALPAFQVPASFQNRPAIVLAHPWAAWAVRPQVQINGNSAMQAANGQVTLKYKANLTWS